MFGRELKTKLPELKRQDSILNQTTKERDWRQKLSQKAYADQKNRASTNPVAPGDQVLLKNTKTTGKPGPSRGEGYPGLLPRGPGQKGARTQTVTNLQVLKDMK